MDLEFPKLLDYDLFINKNKKSIQYSDMNKDINIFNTNNKSK